MNIFPYLKKCKALIKISLGNINISERSVDTGVQPKLWRKSKRGTHIKKKDTSLMTNYRQFSLTLVTGKMPHSITARNKSQLFLRRIN